jgi:hypothetical protein
MPVVTSDLYFRYLRQYEKVRVTMATLVIRRTEGQAGADAVRNKSLVQSGEEAGMVQAFFPRLGAKAQEALVRIALQSPAALEKADMFKLWVKELAPVRIKAIAVLILQEQVCMPAAPTIPTLCRVSESRRFSQPCKLKICGSSLSTTHRQSSHLWREGS